MEYEQAIQSPEVLALDLAHQLAFRKGLGNSLFATPHLGVDLLSAVAYARSSFSQPSGIAVLASGVDGKSFGSLVDDFYTGSTSSASSSSAAAISSTSKGSYYGGEMRVAHTAHGGGDKGQLLVGFQGGAQSAPEYAVLRSLLGGESSLKWANGTAPFSQLTPLVGGTYKPVVKSFNLPYSDAGLFGFFVSAPTDQVRDIATKAVQALKAVASGVKDNDLKRAIAATKFLAANVLESRVARQELIGSQVGVSYRLIASVMYLIRSAYLSPFQLLESGTVLSLADAFAAIDKVTGAKVEAAAKAVLKSKPTVVAIGDTHKLPWADEVGL